MLVIIFSDQFKLVGLGATTGLLRLVFPSMRRLHNLNSQSRKNLGGSQNLGRGRIIESWTSRCSGCNCKTKRVGGAGSQPKYTLDDAVVLPG